MLAHILVSLFMCKKYIVGLQKCWYPTHGCFGLNKAFPIFFYKA